MTIHLRPATLADLPQMVALDRLIFGAYGAEEEPAILDARLHVFPAGCVVLETGDEDAPSAVVGYLTTEKWNTLREPALDEDPHLTHHADGRVLNITTLAVHPQHQNQGLGKLLLDHAIAVAQRQGCCAIILETAHAQHFYRRHGFEKVGERTQRAIHLAIMRRVITPPNI